MIIQIHEKKDLKVGLENVWQNLSSLRVCFFYLKENENAIYEAKRFVDKFEDDKRLEKISDAFETLLGWVDLECFDDMEKETGKVMSVIDKNFFAGALLENLSNEADKD